MRFSMGVSNFLATFRLFVIVLVGIINVKMLKI
jgi:hypothetical protein